MTLTRLLPLVLVLSSWLMGRGNINALQAHPDDSEWGEHTMLVDEKRHEYTTKYMRHNGGLLSSNSEVRATSLFGCSY
jgi:hypothetical protein